MKGIHVTQLVEWKDSIGGAEILSWIQNRAQVDSNYTWLSLYKIHEVYKIPRERASQTVDSCGREGHR
jgi:hypothetical protein